MHRNSVGDFCQSWQRWHAYDWQSYRAASGLGLAEQACLLEYLINRRGQKIHHLVYVDFAHDKRCSQPDVVAMLALCCSNERA